jgi:hypothetical protein
MNTVYAVKRARAHDEIILLMNGKPSIALAHKLAAEITEEPFIMVVIEEMDLFDIEDEDTRAMEDERYAREVEETDRMNMPHRRWTI